MKSRVARMTRDRVTQRASDGDSGAVLIWVALMTIVLLGVSALAVDLGYAYSVKRQLSATSDSAALAGAQEAGLKFSATGVNGCGSTLDSLITDAVNANHTANNPAGSTGDPNVTIECKDKDGNAATGPDDPTSITVKVDETSNLDTWFGRVLGVDTLNPAATATARVFGAQNLAGLRPFIVCLNDAQAARDKFTFDGSTPLYQSYYNKFTNGTTKKDKKATDLVYTGGAWSGTIIRKGNTNHGLSTGDYVSLVNVTAGGDTRIGDFYYYVTRLGPKEFSVSPTETGSALNATLTGTVDVYSAGTPDSSGTWSGTQVTAPTLAAGTTVWVQGTSGTGVTDGEYVITSPSATGFQLSNSSGVASVAGTNDINVYVQGTPNAVGGVACNPPGASGNWGYSKFDLGNSNWSVTCLIKYGYGGLPGGSGNHPNGSECTAPDPSNPFVNVGTESMQAPSSQTGGDPGNNVGPNNDGPEIKELIISGDPILLPVGEDWDPGNGNNAKYDGRGALAVELCGFVFPGNQVSAGSLPSNPSHYYFGACGDQSMYLSAISATPPKVTKDTTLVIQWRFVDYVGGFQGQASGDADQCPLDTCVATLQLLE